MYFRVWNAFNSLVFHVCSVSSKVCPTSFYYQLVNFLKFVSLEESQISPKRAFDVKGILKIYKIRRTSNLGCEAMLMFKLKECFGVPIISCSAFGDGNRCFFIYRERSTIRHFQRIVMCFLTENSFSCRIHFWR